MTESENQRYRQLHRGFSTESEETRQRLQSNSPFPVIHITSQSFEQRLAGSPDMMKMTKLHSKPPEIPPRKLKGAKEPQKQSTSDESNSEAEDKKPPPSAKPAIGHKADDEGGLFNSVQSEQTKQQTMKEYVESYYNAPPARQALPVRPTPTTRRSTTVISPYRKMLPSIVERDQQKQEEQRLVENILNYRHLSSIKERETAHKNRLVKILLASKMKISSSVHI